MRDFRAGYACGLLWAVASVAAGAMVPQPPASGAGADDVASWFAAHHAAITAGSTVSAVAALLMLPFLVAVSSRFGDDEWTARTLRSAAPILVTVALVGGVLQALLAQSAARLEPQSLLAAWTVVSAVFYAAPPIASALALGLAAVGLSHGAAPRWTGVTAAALALVTIVVGTSSLLTDSSGPVGFAGFVLSVLWVGATAITLWRTEPAPEVSFRGARPAVG